MRKIFVAVVAAAGIIATAFAVDASTPGHSLATEGTIISQN
jgi:hypothetical protein